jgi:uncharacterized DUF497 family protein
MRQVVRCSWLFTFGMKDGQRLIRPVSARYMHKKEIEAYETESP